MRDLMAVMHVLYGPLATSRPGSPPSSSSSFSLHCCGCSAAGALGQCAVLREGCQSGRKTQVPRRHLILTGLVAERHRDPPETVRR